MNGKQVMEWTQMSMFPPPEFLVAETTGISEPQGRNMDVTVWNPHAIPVELTPTTV
jgi:hypothetical protein